jgi:formate dehydrogenase (quinone-dependent) catalytic subunit
MNPACGGASANKTRQAMTKLDWMVNVNIFDNETGSFWKGPGMDPKKIKTEVFMLPCAVSIEKEGSITNSGRWMQWRYKAVNSPGVAIPDGEIITELFYKIKDLYEKEGGPVKEAITKMTWDYGPMGADGKIRHVDARATSDKRFPYVCSTYRVSEHWQTGLMTRWTPWLAEMQPDMFVEMSIELAKLKGIKNGEQVTVKSIRGEVDAVTIVTPRFKPFNIDGQVVHQVGMPWHYGWVTTNMRKYVHGDKKPEIFTSGDSANLCTPYIGDANTMIPESKAFMVNVERKEV